MLLPASPPPRPVRVVAALGFGVAGDGRLLLGGVGLGQYLSIRYSGSTPFRFPDPLLLRVLRRGILLRPFFRLN